MSSLYFVRVLNEFLGEVRGVDGKPGSGDDYEGPWSTFSDFVLDSSDFLGRLQPSTTTIQRTPNAL